MRKNKFNAYIFYVNNLSHPFRGRIVVTENGRKWSSPALENSSIQDYGQKKTQPRS